MIPDMYDTKDTSVKVQASEITFEISDEPGGLISLLSESVRIPIAAIVLLALHN